MKEFDLQDLKKKSNLYILVAIGISILWLFVVGAFLLPTASKSKAKALKRYASINELATKIYALDPARINYASAKANGDPFIYSIEINKIAIKHGISPGDYNLSTQKTKKNKGRKSQAATMAIENVDIASLSAFLSEILDVWPDLVCENLKLRADKKRSDVWKVTLKFNYSIAK